jgi:hypothetical protein
LLEIEDLETLLLFNEDLLQGIQDTNHSPHTANEKYYKYAILLDANDNCIDHGTTKEMPTQKAVSNGQ